MRAHTEGKYEMGKRFATVASATQGRSATWISSIALVVMVLGAAWLAAAPQAAEARPSPCGGGPQKYKSEIEDFVVRNVSCNYAKRVASHHIKTGDRRFNGWKCDDDKHGEGVDTTCQRHRKGEIQRIDYSLKRRDTRHAALGAQTATSSTGESVDSVPPDLQLSGKKKQKLGQPVPTRGCLEHGRCPRNVQVEASCEHERVDGMVAPGEGCTVSAEGKLTKVKKDKLKPTRVLGSADLWPGDGCSVVPVEEVCTATLALKLTKKTYKQVRKALDNGKKVHAKITVDATDAAGNVATAKRTITLVK